MTDDAALIRERIEASVAVKRALLADEHVALVSRIADLWAEALRGGGKVLFCGNGGSAADAMHLSAELVGRFKLDRAPLASISLSDNASAMTAIANDYSYEETFSRQVRGLGRPGDVLVALSTSGNSPNVVEAVDAAAEIGVRTVACTGEGGGRLRETAELWLGIPSADTARIQEGYMLLLHTCCELAERALAAETRAA